METKKINTVALIGLESLKTDECDLYDYILGAILLFYNRGVRIFHASLLTGFDALAAKILIQLKESYPEVRIKLIVPKDPVAGFSEYSEDEYLSLLENFKEDEKEFVDTGYCGDWQNLLIDGYADKVLYNADLLITYFDGNNTENIFPCSKIRRINVPAINLFHIPDEYPEDVSENILSATNETACDLAATKLEEETGLPFEELLESEEGEECTRYKKEYLDRFDKYYDYYSDILVRLQLCEICNRQGSNL